MTSRRKTSSRRAGDYLVMRVLRVALSGSVIMAVVLTVIAVLWMTATGGDVPTVLSRVIVFFAGVAISCHYLLGWVRKALR